MSRSAVLFNSIPPRPGTGLARGRILVDGRTDGRMDDGWTDERMDRQMNREVIWVQSAHSSLTSLPSTTLDTETRDDPDRQTTRIRVQRARFPNLGVWSRSGLCARLPCDLGKPLTCAELLIRQSGWKRLNDTKA